MIKGYIPKEKRKNILFLCDDIRMSSGISTMAREIVTGTAHQINWICVGAAIEHPDIGKKIDLSLDTNRLLGIEDASVILYPYNGYGDADLIRLLIKTEKPDAILFFTDPRFYIWLFQIEHEVRKRIPMIYLNIWDDLPYPMYNQDFYASCDGLLAISKQTENINKVVLGDKAKDKIIKYCPHGINENIFFPIDENHPNYSFLVKFKDELFGKKKYDFVLLFNSRNIRRKNISDLLLAYKIFIDSLPIEKAEKCALVLHTQAVDENGTDLIAVSEMLYGEEDKYNVIIHEQKLPPENMNLLYNSCDANILISSNEGWGLSLTEAMMSGKMIIANSSGGMQDQMRFEDKNGNWIKFTPEFPSNHQKTYEKCGEWAIPIFPSNLSLVGSVLTPYIFDDRVSFKDISTAISKCYNINKEERIKLGLKAREWVISDESMMSARLMCKNIMDGINETIDNFKPMKEFELIKIDSNKKPKHYTGLPLVY